MSTNQPTQRQQYGQSDSQHPYEDRSAQSEPAVLAILPGRRDNQTDQQAQRQSQEYGPLRRAQLVIEQLRLRHLLTGQQVAYHLTLEQLDFSNQLESPLLLSRHNALREIVHRLLDEELLLDGNLSRQSLTARWIPVHLPVQLVWKHPQHLSLIEHIHHVEFLVGNHQRLAVLCVLAGSHLIKCFLQLILMILVPEVCIGCPLAFNTQQLLHSLVFDADDLLLLPRRVVNHPAGKNLVGGIAVPRCLARQLRDEIYRNRINRAYSVVV